MPSKKAIRDKAATNSFFNQDPHDGCTLSVCTSCGSKQNQKGSSHELQLKQANARNYRAATNEFDKIAKNFKNLLAEEDKRRKASPLTSCLPNDWGLSHLQKWERIIELDGSDCEKEFESYNNQDREIKQKLQSEASSNSTVSKPEALRLSNLIVDIKHLNQVIYRCSQSTLFFNIEKKFAFPEETIQEIKDWGKEETHTLESKLKPETNLRQRFNAPIRMISDKSKSKHDDRLYKKVPALTALAEMERNCKWLSNEMRTISESISDDYSDACKPPKNMWAFGHAVPASLPQAVCQSLWDLDFLADQMTELHTALVDQRDLIRSTLLIWIGSGEEVWNWGVEQMPNLPEFQKYEYMRLDMEAMHVNAFREHEKVVEYFLSREKCSSPSSDSPFFAALETELQIGKHTKADRQALFESRATFEPADEMVESLEQYQHALEAEAVNTVGSADWLKDVVRMLPKDLVKSLAMHLKAS